MKVACLKQAELMVTTARRSIDDISPQGDAQAKLVTTQRLLLFLWLAIGVTPLVLQTRSYIKFVLPHQIPRTLVGSGDKETTNLTDLCPVTGYLLSNVGWSSEATHYYNTEEGVLCHVVMPQYNVHGNYRIGSSKVARDDTAPSSCDDDSYPYHQYFYHGSIGYYSFYEEHTGTYCARNNISYISTITIGSFDLNGSFLADDPGDTKNRRSFWYGSIGAIWLFYRVLVLRRSCVLCIHHGQKCDELGDRLSQKEAMVFVQESLRLSAHGATNYHRLGLLYLIIEGIMTDLFLLIASDGLATKLQYASLGYNLSGLLLLLYEMVSATRFMSEKWRQFTIRLLFSYETSLFGELVTAGVLQYFLTGLNTSDLKRTRGTALAVSYYFWSVICHAVVVVVIILVIVTVRTLVGIVIAWSSYRSLAVFTEPCCVDTTIGVRSRVSLLGGYRFDDGKLFVKQATLKAFGLFKMEEEGVEYLALQKLLWFRAPRNNFFAIGVIKGDLVEPCNERPCTGLIGFFDKDLGGPATREARHHITPHCNQNKVLAITDLNGIP